MDLITQVFTILRKAILRTLTITLLSIMAVNLLATLLATAVLFVSRAGLSTSTKLDIAQDLIDESIRFFTWWAG